MRRLHLEGIWWVLAAECAGLGRAAGVSRDAREGMDDFLRFVIWIIRSFEAGRFLFLREEGGMVGSGPVRGFEAAGCWLGRSPIGCKIYKTVLPAICCRRCVCQSSVMSPCSSFLTAVPWPISPLFVNGWCLLINGDKFRFPLDEKEFCGSKYDKTGNLTYSLTNGLATSTKWSMVAREPTCWRLYIISGL